MVSLLVIGLMVVGSLIGSYGTYVVKKSTNTHSLFQIWRSRELWLGLVMYAFAVLVYIFVLRQEKLSVVYPLASLSYIWITLFSVKGLGEKMNKWKWLGLAGIIIGVTLVGAGS